jgi:hypothetical protein
MLEVDAFGGDPFVETFVEFLIVHIESRFAFSRGYGENLCFAVFAVLVVNSSVSGLFVDWKRSLLLK